MSGQGGYQQGQGVPNQQMMGQPGPQMNQQISQVVNQQQSQPRSPLIHGIQQQTMNMCQSPLATGNPLSVGAMSQQNMGPGSQGPSSVQPIGGPQSIGGDYSGGPQSVNQSLQPPSVQQSIGGPQSVGGPLSVPQQMSVQPMSVQPMSVQPMSVQPATPMNPASQPPPNQNQAPSTPAQGVQAVSSWSVTTDLPRESTSPDPPPTLVSDPSGHVKNLILKDLRHSIVRMNIVAGDSLKERKQEGSSGRTVHDLRDDQIKTMDNFLAVCDHVETNLTLLLETQKHAQKFEKIFDKEPSKEQAPFLGVIEGYIESTAATQRMLDQAMNQLNKTRGILKKREEIGKGEMDVD